MAQRRRPTRLRRPRLAAALVAAVLVLLTPGGAAADEHPTVTVDRASAPAGVQVVAVASRFDGCVAPTDPPGPLVELRMVLPLTTASLRRLPWAESTEEGKVSFRWDDAEEVAAAELSEGAAKVDFTIPTDASVGQHVLTARCVGDDSVVGRTVVEVEPPVVMPTIVPSLTGLTVPEAQVELKLARLVLGDVEQLEGDLVQSQTPGAGTEAEPGSAVDVVVGEAPPTLVEVPILQDLGLQEATARLEAAGLVLGAVTGTGVVDTQSHAPGVEVPLGTPVDVSLVTPGLVAVPGLVGLPLDEASELLADRELALGQVTGEDPQADSVVDDQVPEQGALVERGSAVSVSVDPSEPPPVLVEVPDVVGGSAGEARRSLEEVGLEAVGTGDPEAVVEGQSPPAGTLVPPGTPVAMTMTAPASDSLAPTVLWGVVLMVGVAVTASLVNRATRTRRGRRWAARHVRVVSGAAPPPSHGTEEAAEPSELPTTAIRLHPRRDSGTHLVEEVHR